MKEQLNIIMKAFDTLSYADQVELFLQVRKQLISTREERANSLKREVEDINKIINELYGGSKYISSQLEP